MIFTDKTHDREIEKLFGRPPGFRPRGHGIFVSEKAEYNAERCGCREWCRQKEETARVGRKNALCGATDPHRANPTAKGADGNLHSGDKPRIYYPN